MKKFNQLLLSTLIIMLTFTVSEAQKKKKKNKEPVALQLYDGPEQPREQVARLVSDDLGKQYAYFIAVNDEEISSNNLMDGVKEILLLPGDHKIQVRFVAKGEIAIPVEPFEPLLFEAGKSYTVRFEYIPGSGGSSDYIGAAQRTRIKFWIEESGLRLAEMTVDGLGKIVTE